MIHALTIYIIQNLLEIVFLVLFFAIVACFVLIGICIVLQFIEEEKACKHLNRKD